MRDSEKNFKSYIVAVIIPRFTKELRVFCSTLLDIVLGPRREEEHEDPLPPQKDSIIYASSILLILVILGFIGMIVF